MEEFESGRYPGRVGREVAPLWTRGFGVPDKMPPRWRDRVGSHWCRERRGSSRVWRNECGVRENDQGANSGGGGRTVKSVGRKTGTDKVRRELVRGGGATGPKSRKKFRPMIEEETLTVSQWSVPNLGRGHREHLADSGNACRGRTYRSGSEAQESIREVDFSSWEPTIYKKNL